MNKSLSKSLNLDFKEILLDITSNVAKVGCGEDGWKLSNRPWNLQVIASSLGSLTRFKLDDIPSVMVYMGVLFSWFARHVKDYELHDMNCLYNGAPKAWYIVIIHLFSKKPFKKRLMW